MKLPGGLSDLKVVKGKRGGVVGFGFRMIGIPVCRTASYDRSKSTFSGVQCITEKGYIQSEYFLFTYCHSPL